MLCSSERSVEARPMEFLGIDFSGNARSCQTTSTTSNVWVCHTKCRSDQKLQVTELRPVQNLEGTGSPFKRLADILAQKQFSAAAIDAPLRLCRAHKHPSRPLQSQRHGLP